ncbi:hypothetical protein DL764_001100 [Monosporascus ibericus]|uniref:Nucleoside phosphorylase domain-containing protein n=1 Tax=Monosporascus ibericus TaxID=155417 RepID=A0A4Q4TQX4_9PEZI|nr:hypothetical protein DL764_001100 [Monosporascus ibericus]
MGRTVLSYTLDSYTIACICPLSVEQAAVEGMLDEIHPTLPTERDENSYTFGRIGEHNIVVASMPETGMSTAATVATQLVNDFKSIRFGLLVGIGGGISVEGEHDIGLGDVVVGKPTDTFGGVVQFDRGKTHTGQRFERTGTLNKPPHVLLSNVRKLESKHLRESNRITQNISVMLEKYPGMDANQYRDQGVSHDMLFEATYPHQGGPGCQSCDRRKLTDRPPRAAGSPQVHYGTIGSANRVIKDGVSRQKLYEDLGIICVEMEAAGLMDEFPCLVIRGICDYADSHKNKRWQPYAAATAAAYMKELLEIIPPSQVDRTPRAVDTIKDSQKKQSQVPKEYPARDEFLGKVAQLEARNQYLEERNQERVKEIESLKVELREVHQAYRKNVEDSTKMWKDLVDQSRTVPNQPSVTQPPVAPESIRRQLRGFYDQRRVDEALARYEGLFRHDLQVLMSSYRHNYWDFMPGSLDRMRDFEDKYKLNRVGKALQHGETLMGETVTSNTPRDRVHQYGKEDTWRYILAGVGHRYQHTGWLNQNHANSLNRLHEEGIVGSRTRLTGVRLGWQIPGSPTASVASGPDGFMKVVLISVEVD